MVVRRIARLEQRFVRRDGSWKIGKFSLRILATLREGACISPDRLPPQAERFAHWKTAPAPTGNRHSALDVFYLERLLLEWTTRLKTGHLSEFMEKYMVTGRDDVALGFSRFFEGREAVQKRLAWGDAVRPTLRYHSPIVHTGTTPVIEVSEDGTVADAFWLDHSFTNKAEAFGMDEYPLRYHINVCKYTHRFIKENGEWKLHRFAWEVVFSLEDWIHDPESGRGWAGRPQSVPWPNPFEPYQYGTEECVDQ